MAAMLDLDRFQASCLVGLIEELADTTIPDQLHALVGELRTAAAH